jgi:hypothetical protein
MWSLSLTILLISTSCRHTPIDQPSGHLIVFELETRRVIKRCEIIEAPYQYLNPNPRGGLRGLKGIGLYGNRIAIANTSTIFIYDSQWKPIDYFWHPSCAGIHDIAMTADRAWVTSSRNDLLFEFSLSGKLVNYFDARTFFPLMFDSGKFPKPFLSQSQIEGGSIDFRDPRTHDEGWCDASHINGLGLMRNGDLLVSCGLIKNLNHQQLLVIKNWMVRKGIWSRVIQINKAIRRSAIKRTIHDRRIEDLVVQPVHGKSGIVRISSDGKVNSCLTIGEVTAPSHSVRELIDGTAVYLRTTTGKLLHFDPMNGRTIEEIFIGNHFLRGARELADNTLILGDNNILVHFDLNKQKELFSRVISDDPTEAIFDICVLPDHFDLPPNSFVNHHQKYLPVVQV